MRQIEYKIDNENKLYFLPEYNRFALNNLDFDIEQDFYDTSLFKLRIEISHLCNGRCKYCLVFGNNVENMEVLNIEEFWEYLTSQEWFKSIRNIFIIGGEPLIFYKEICFIIDHFQGRISFSTNGTLLTQEMVDRFSKSNVAVYISLDGPTFEDNVNRVYENGKYMYYDIIRGLNLLKNSKVEFGVFMVACTETIGRAKDMIMQLDKEYGPSRIGYSLPHWTPGYKDVNLAKEFRDVMIELFKHRKEIKASIPQLDWRLNPLKEGKVKRFSCGLHTTQTTVLPDRSFVRCSKLDNEHDDLKGKITNEMLNQNSPIELSKNQNSPCSKCVALASCGGGCPFDGMKRFNCLTDKRECEITPELIDLAVNEVVKAFRENKIDVKDGLISVEVISDLIRG